MKFLHLLLLFVVFVGCNKSEKSADPKSSSLDAAAADFKSRVAAFQTAKIENVVFADVRHDVTRTNSITSPLKAQVSVKKIVREEKGTHTVYDVTIYAAFTDDDWHYERCVGKMTSGLEVIDFEEQSNNIQSAYDFVKTLRLKHDDVLRHEQFK